MAVVPLLVEEVMKQVEIEIEVETVDTVDKAHNDDNDDDDVLEVEFEID